MSCDSHCIRLSRAQAPTPAPTAIKSLVAGPPATTTNHKRLVTILESSRYTSSACIPLARGTNKAIFALTLCVLLRAVSDLARSHTPHAGSHHCHTGHRYADTIRARYPPRDTAQDDKLPSRCETPSAK